MLLSSSWIRIQELYGVNLLCRKIDKGYDRDLELPDHIIPIGMVVVGIKDEDKDSVR